MGRYRLEKYFTEIAYVPELLVPEWFSVAKSFFTIKIVERRANLNIEILQGVQI